MADIIQDLMDLRKKIEKTKLSKYYLVPDSIVKEAAEVFKNTNSIVCGGNGAMYQYGVQIKKPGTSISVAFLNAKIEAMNLPDYLKSRPKGVHVYLRGISGPYRIYGGARGGGKSFITHFLNAEEENHED